MSGFSDPILDGAGNLAARAQEQSPNFVTGVSGWRISQDGSAEFNNIVIRGATTDQSTVLVYNGTPAAGNLIVSIAPAAGTDSFGNSYGQGVEVFAGASILFQPETDGAHTAGGILPFKGIGVGDLPELLLESPYYTAGNTQAVIKLKGGGSNAPTTSFITLTAPGTGNIQLFIGSAQWTFGSDGSLANAVSSNGNSVQIGDASTVAAFASGRDNATDDAYSARLTGDSNSRWVAESGGKQWWGPGGGTAVDTFIQREAAGTLGISSRLIRDGQTWQTPTLGTGWSAGPLSGTFQAVQYRLDAEDNLIIQGAVHTTSATPASTIFTLASGWRPAVSWRGPGAVKNDSGTPVVCFLEVNSSGAVSITANEAASSHDLYFSATVPMGVIS